MSRLARETSPYLLQHADNPVEWYPWGDEAFERARRDDRPVLLSIGYSACHWCHVMAHESFEDPEVAAAMNRDFVCVKVDREERPDVDQIYQTAHALMTRRNGGWPLTVFMTPDGDPFFAGTYFPKHGRQGLPGLLDLLPHIARVYREKKEAIAEQGEELRRALATLEPEAGDPAAPLPVDVASRLLDDLRSTFDRVHGGFGKAPKFPHVVDLELALRAFLQRGDRDALEIARVTAAKMADGGIHDQLGGGFARYSVDARWEIPHFEKMLYDNGPLLGLYADLARIEPDPRLDAAAAGIAGWMSREMRADDGAFFASLDADSEGEEGRYYVWRREELASLLDDDELAVATRHFGFDRPPNFEGRAWNPIVAEPIERVAAELSLTEPAAAALVQRARQKLFEAREARVRPGLDDKILTSWNALAIAGLARAGRRLGRREWIDLATAALDALRSHHWRGGRLLATRKGGRAHLNGYLDDYAFLLAALDETMQARFRLEDFEWACEIADVLIERFEDRAAGGFWFTSHDHEPLIHRPMPGHDNATPSGNGVAARALIALGHLAVRPAYVEAAERAVRRFADAMATAPQGFATLAIAAEEIADPPSVVLLSGEANVTGGWHRAMQATPRPAVRCYDVAGIELPPELRKGPLPAGARAVGWVCTATSCLPPLDSIEGIERALASR
jgi:uncharacterized protein